jgi:hypothetical protein
MHTSINWPVALTETSTCRREPVEPHAKAALIQRGDRQLLRDKDGYEVDIVLQSGTRYAGIEISNCCVAPAQRSPNSRADE